MNAAQGPVDFWLVTARAKLARCAFPMAVPLLDLKRQNLALEAELRAACERVLRSGHYILGAEVEALELELAQELGVKHALGVSSGTDALLLALMALEIGPGDEVLVPTFTFFASAGCVARVGATPVFVDVCPVCFNLDVADAEAKISARTKAIMPVHLFGQAADLEAVSEFARMHRLAVIEDAAQALGARFRGRPVGGLGTCGAFSFFPTKNLGALGDAGLFTCQDDALAERAALLRVHGMKPKYHHQAIGGNFRLDALQAALLRVKLPHHAAYSRARAAHAAWYTGHLSRVPGVMSGRAVDCHRHAPSAGPRTAATPAPFALKLTLPSACPELGHIWNQYTLRVHGPGRRDALLAHLRERGIGAEIYYPLTLDQQPCFDGVGRGGETCVLAHALAGEVLSLPIFPELTPAEREEVADAVEEFVRAG
jgi:dTDP-4-amino-4,6-dideoxygalactose transaminase